MGELGSRPVAVAGARAACLGSHGARDQVARAGHNAERAGDIWPGQLLAWGPFLHPWMLLLLSPLAP